MPLAATLSSLRQCTIPYIFKFPDIAPVVDNSLRKSFDSYIENCKSFFNFMFHICLINIPDTTSGLLMACLTIKDKSYVGILHFVHFKENPFLSFYRMYVMNQKKTFISAPEIFSFLFLFFLYLFIYIFRLHISPMQLTKPPNGFHFQSLSGDIEVHTSPNILESCPIQGRRT